jgi:hypothetical protein
VLDITGKYRFYSRKGMNQENMIVDFAMKNTHRLKFLKTLAKLIFLFCQGGHPATIALYTDDDFGVLQAGYVRRRPSLPPKNIRSNPTSMRLSSYPANQIQNAYARIHEAR